MRTFDILKHFFKDHLVEIATRLSYDISNIYILAGDEKALRENCPQIYENLLSCTHHRDSRTSIEYARDIVASWILEDSIIWGLKHHGLNICHAGADKGRIILPNSRVLSNSDAMVSVNGIEAKLEIMCDYTGFWSRQGKLHLRDDKVVRLAHENSLFLGFDTTNHQYLFIDFSKPVPTKFIKSHQPYGGKPAREITLFPSYPLKPMTYDAITDDIKTVIQERAMKKNR